MKNTQVTGQASPQYTFYSKRPKIHELGSFGCDIYNNTPKPLKMYNKTQ